MYKRHTYIHLTSLKRAQKTIVTEDLYSCGTIKFNTQASEKSLMKEASEESSEITLK